MILHMLIGIIAGMGAGSVLYNFSKTKDKKFLLYFLMFITIAILNAMISIK